MSTLPAVGQLTSKQKQLLEELLKLQSSMNLEHLTVLFNAYLSVQFKKAAVKKYLEQFKKALNPPAAASTSTFQRGKRLVDWDDEKEQFIFELFGNGFVFADIAEALNTKYGTQATRNAVRGKIKRSKNKLANVKKQAEKAETDKADVLLVNTAEDEENFIMELRGQGFTSQEVAQKVEHVFDVKLSAEEVRNKMRAIILKRRRENGLAEDKFEEVLLDQDLRSVDARQRVLEYIASANEALAEHDHTQFMTTVEVPNDVEWQLVIFAGDWHVGSQMVDMRRLMRETQLIAETPNCWYVFIGDATDNFTSGIKITDGQHEQSVPPKVARVAVGALFDILSEKLLAVATGCHDLWSVNIDDYNLVEELSQRHNCAYLGYGGKIHLQAGEVLYKMTGLHKFRMNSTLNIDHACRRYLQLEDMDNDIIAIAHNHTPFVGLEMMQDRPRALIRTAAYKGLDRFAEKLTIKDGLRLERTEDKVFMPCVLLNTRRHGIRIAHSIPEGIGLLHFLNSLTPEEYQAMYGDVKQMYGEAAG